MIKDKAKWKRYIEKNKDPYGAACVKIAKKVMEYLDEIEDFDANHLISRADNEYKEGITGFMAGAVVAMVSQCHSRGDEFKESWNGHFGDKKRKGVINPAILKVKIN